MSLREGDPHDDVELLNGLNSWAGYAKLRLLASQAKKRKMPVCPASSLPIRPGTASVFVQLQMN